MKWLAALCIIGLLPACGMVQENELLVASPDGKYIAHIVTDTGGGPATSVLSKIYLSKMKGKREEIFRGDGIGRLNVEWEGNGDVTIHYDNGYINYFKGYWSSGAPNSDVMIALCRADLCSKKR